jgi:hypothetical protein
VTEEPRGFHAAPEHPLYLAGRDTFLAGAHEVDDLEPQPQRQVARLEQGANPHGEWLPAAVALVKAGTGAFASELAYALPLPAMVADRAIGPQPGFDIGESGFFIVEVRLRENGLGHG